MKGMGHSQQTKSVQTACGKERESLESADSLFTPDHITTSKGIGADMQSSNVARRPQPTILFNQSRSTLLTPNLDQHPTKPLNPTAGDCARPHGQAGPHRRGRPGRPKARDDPSTADHDRQRRLGEAVFGANVADSERAQRRADGAAVPGAQPAAGQAQGVEAATPVLPRPDHLPGLASGEASGLTFLQSVQSSVKLWSRGKDE